MLVASCPRRPRKPRVDNCFVEGVSALACHLLLLCCDYSLSALHEAAASGHLELTQVLVEHGAAVDLHDNEGCCIH